MYSIKQSFRLAKLGVSVICRTKPLGIGLKNECWGGLAASNAMQNNSKTTTYFGITFQELKDAINKNNRTDPRKRNFIMGLESMKLASMVVLRSIH